MQWVGGSSAQVWGLYCVIPMRMSTETYIYNFALPGCPARHVNLSLLILLEAQEHRVTDGLDGRLALNTITLYTRFERIRNQ